MQAVKAAAKVRRKALCCVCGNLRTVSPDYHRSNDPNYGYGDQARSKGWRDTQTLKCDACEDRTRHALLRPTHVGDPDYDEKRQRYILGGEWPDQYAPDRERLRAEYFALFPRNPKLSHRFWTKEADELRANGETHMVALCGATAEIPKKWSTKKRDPDELIEPDRIDWDTEFEDPATGLWWIDMDCVDCLRVANERRHTRRRQLLESWLAWFACHPETIPDAEADALIGVQTPIAEALNEKDG
ncbi:hypothetical protein [Mycolicibacterium sp.]|uniref:hypothetical protein n=1 Tax=Mycolicibacterium sp. TaxID=2320850 RepID=UPI003D0A8E9A